MKHILEYEDHELRDLLGDLDSVGHMKKYVGTLWAAFKTYKLMDGFWTPNPEFVCFLKTHPIYATGNEDRDKALMLEAIQKGNFDRPNDPDVRSWSALEKGNKMVTDFLAKQNLQSLAKTCSTVDDLVQKISESLVRIQKISLEGQMHLTRYSHSEEDASSVSSYGFLAPVGSPYTGISNFSELNYTKGILLRHSDVRYVKD